MFEKRRAELAELVDALDSGSSVLFGLPGSSPGFRISIDISLQVDRSGWRSPICHRLRGKRLINGPTIPGKS